MLSGRISIILLSISFCTVLFIEDAVNAAVNPVAGGPTFILSVDKTKLKLDGTDLFVLKQAEVSKTHVTVEVKGDGNITVESVKWKFKNEKGNGMRRAMAS